MEGEAVTALPAEQPQGYIFGGENALPHEFPYQVRVGSWNGGICGGTIIHTLFILTAAHCLQNANKNRWKVFAGDHSRSYNDELTEQIRKISHVYAHEDFNSVTFENDIALLVLAHPLEFNEYVKNIEYPRKKNTEYEGNATVSGWGKLEESHVHVPDILQKVTVPLVSKSECQRKYNRSEPRVTNEMMCAGTSTADSCVGDSGGPLTCIEKKAGRKVVCGIVSFGIGCGRKEFPGVYTDVSYYWQWIELTMAKHIHGDNFLGGDSTTPSISLYPSGTPTPIPSSTTDLPGTTHNTPIQVMPTMNTGPGSNCKLFKMRGHNHSGIYSINPDGILGNNSINVFCDMEDDSGGWTVIQRRSGYSVSNAQQESFHRNLTEYEEGFGSPTDDHWIGLRSMHSLTRHCKNELKITLTRPNGTEYYGGYSNFKVAKRDEDYRLKVGNWTGGTLKHDGDMMEWNDGMKFTTFDKDNDEWEGGNCAVKENGAWWHNSYNGKYCTYVNFNVEYTKHGSHGIMEVTYPDITWIVHGWNYYSGMKSEMKIRPLC